MKTFGRRVKWVKFQKRIGTGQNKLSLGRNGTNDEKNRDLDGGQGSGRIARETIYGRNYETKRQKKLKRESFWKKLKSHTFSRSKNKITSKRSSTTTTTTADNTIIVN